MLVHGGNSLGRRTNLPAREADAGFDRRTKSIFMAGPHCRDHMGPLHVFLRVSFAGFAAILANVSGQSYARHRERGFLLLCAPFSVFLCHRVWLVAEAATRARS